MTTFKEHSTHASDHKLNLAEILEIFASGSQPLKFTAYDGSSAGPENATLGLDLKTPRGTTYLATAPGDLGLARAYVSGDLEPHGVHPGDPYPLLCALAEDGVQTPAGPGAGQHRPLHRHRAPCRSHRLRKRPCPGGAG